MRATEAEAKQQKSLNDFECTKEAFKTTLLYEIEQSYRWKEFTSKR